MTLLDLYEQIKYQNILRDLGIDKEITIKDTPSTPLKRKR